MYGNTVLQEKSPLGLPGALAHICILPSQLELLESKFWAKTINWDSRLSSARTSRMKTSCINPGDGNPQDLGMCIPLEGMVTLSMCLYCPPVGSFRLHLPLHVFFLYRCIFLSVHWNTSPASSGRKSPSASEPERWDATKAAGNFLLKCFFSSWKCLFKPHWALCECRNFPPYHWRVLLGFFPKNHTL